MSRLSLAGDFWSGISRIDPESEAIRDISDQTLHLNILLRFR
jgi:hypothetical protein